MGLSSRLLERLRLACPVYYRNHLSTCRTLGAYTQRREASFPCGLALPPFCWQSCTVLLLKCQHMHRSGTGPWRVSGAFPCCHPTTSLRLRVNAPGAGETYWKVTARKMRSRAIQGSTFSKSEGYDSCLSVTRTHNPANEFSALTGHRGHCLLTQPGQEPCHLQKGVHTFRYFHMSVSNFLKKKKIKFKSG